MNDSEFERVFERYAELSEGDKSCVLAMLQTPNGQQMTSIGSAHDRFYKELSKFGLAKSVDLTPELEAIGVVRSWYLTDDGRRSFRVLLLRFATAEIGKELSENKWTEFGKFGLKLFFCYVVCQIVGFLTVVSITRLGIEIPTLRGYAPILFVFALLTVSLYLSSKIWRHSEPHAKRVYNIAYSEFIVKKCKSLTVVTVLIVLGIHIASEMVAVQVVWQTQVKSPQRILTQIVVLAALVGFFTVNFLPQTSKAYLDRQFKAK